MSTKSDMGRKPLLSSLSQWSGKRVPRPSLARTSGFRVSLHMDVKDSSVDEFLSRIVDNSSKTLENAYLAERELYSSTDDGSLFLALCEDIYSQIHNQLDLVHEFLMFQKIEKTDIGIQLVMAVLLSIIRTLHKLQHEHRDRFLVDLESSCAAANEFTRMIECFDDVIESVNERYPRLKMSSLIENLVLDHDNRIDAALIQCESSNLVALYANDAVHAVERSHIFVMQVIQDSSIPKELFSQQWEEEYVFNEVAIAIVKTSEDFLNECHSFLSCTYLYSKLVGALIRSIVCFYVQCLLRKAKRVWQLPVNIIPLVQEEKQFGNKRKMILRMMYDVEVFRVYFCTLVEKMPQLAQLVEGEISILIVVHECLVAAIESENQDDIEELIPVLHKRTGANVTITQCVLKDLWVLARGSMKALDDALLRMLNDLKLLSENLSIGNGESMDAQQLYYSPAFLFKEMLKEHYENNSPGAFHESFGQCFSMHKETNSVPEFPNTLNMNVNEHTSPLKSIKNYWKAPLDLLSKAFFQDGESPSAQALEQAERHWPESHEKALISLTRQMSVELNLNSGCFIRKCPKLDLERRRTNTDKVMK